VFLCHWEATNGVSRRRRKIDEEHKPLLEKWMQAVEERKYFGIDVVNVVPSLEGETDTDE
jgi:hypothetical protein